ncbi:MAG: hypothetical protein A3B37_02025 [Candidatus Sungbacteria bacterium RIFCSPLOWO2_01_FULL_59_16]|uniref:Transcriptional regulator n=1 Tax=Candidatus Sungbacteria bacterium RIFCSPLOWO2_01_FULL_59_16 TaxID=1802280 RepID=A0A1G2LCV8_9BACT|nr:MAG: hypothetical protein A3B37_02025 [Candidatus Sungbacteria bacterium RIFCSPLOWO2_01_FULL_59_16]
MRPNFKRRAVRRLRIIGGQVRGLENMTRDEEYCIKILHQSLAIKAALSSFEDVILREHLRTHVAEQMRSGKRRKAVGEILRIYRLSKKK